MRRVNTWPPTERKPGVDLISLMMRAQARLFGGKLVWLRDYDEEFALGVAFQKGDRLMANRFWPHYRPLVLEPDGRCTSARNEGDYCRHWIAAAESEMASMFAASHEVYAEPLKD